MLRLNFENNRIKVYKFKNFRIFVCIMIFQIIKYEFHNVKIPPKYNRNLI